ncbi:MAG: Plug domain-containing protein, partial [Prevotella sp.]|nr:Plug domain-containing protein [Prevotella sp.]
MQHFFCLRHALAVFALVLCLVGYAANGQQADTLRSRRLGEVKVSGSNKQKDVNNSAPEQTLTIKDMEQMGASSVSDAVRHMAGVTLHDYGGAGGLKTVSIRGLGAQFTGVSYDGVPLSDVQTGQIDLQRYTLNGVKQLDLLIGEGNDIFIAARETVMPSLLSISTQGVSHKDHDLHLMAQAVMGAWGYTSPMLSAEKAWGKVAVNVQADYVYAENDYPFTIYNIK